MKGEMVGLILVIALYLASIGASRNEVENTEECPLWTFNHNGSCVCAHWNHQIVKCNPLNKSLSIRILYCMTVDPDLIPFVGPCLYNISTNLFKDIQFLHFYNRIATNTTSNINLETCGVYKRRGLMCGQCIENYGLPVYSYHLACVKCLHYKYNWLKYIAVAYLPLTVFCLVVVIFRISANSGLLVGHVTVCQMVITFSLTQSYLALYSGTHYQIIKVLSTFYSIWNLDFFRSLYPPFCLNPNISALGVLSLDYLVAIYPMSSVVITYFLVQGLSYVAWLSRPVYKYLRIFKKEWKVKNSLIEAFATLLLLSYVKILNVTISIVMPIYLYGMNGMHDRLHVYKEPQTMYLSERHLPYFILAIAMSFVFNFLPILLMCLYTCSCFQKCHNRTGLRHQALTTFKDAFQGCYKHKPYYLRSFPAIYLMAQVTNLLILVYFGIEQYHSAASLNLMVIIVLVAIARPYKNKWHNVITLTLFSSIFIAYITVVFQLTANITIKAVAKRWNSFLEYLSCAGSLIPLLYGLILILWKILPARIVMKVKKNLESNKISPNDALPHRFECNHENSSLLT